jgi:phospholipid transport system transporter-binding protein
MTAAHMSLPATLTQAQAALVSHELETAIANQQGTFVLDTSAIQSFDSSALAVLLGACRAAARQRVPLQITGLPARAAQLAALYGLTDILSAHLTAQTAN